MSPERTDSRLLEAALDVTSSLDLQRVLENFVERACALTGARYAGLSVLDTWGDTTLFVEYGDAPAGEASNLPDELVQRITDEGYAIPLTVLKGLRTSWEFLSPSRGKSMRACTWLIAWEDSDSAHCALCRLWRRQPVLLLKTLTSMQMLEGARVGFEHRSS